jgi:hypothetical protein
MEQWVPAWNETDGFMYERQGRPTQQAAHQAHSKQAIYFIVFLRWWQLQK